MIKSSFTQKWYVFYTYPKFEKKVHDYLLEKGYESFLPVHWVVRQWSDRKKRMQVPMFPNYIFVKIECNKVFEVLKTPKLVSCVKFNNVPACLRQAEVDNIRQITESEYNFEISNNLKVGDPVKIKEGALSGLEGVLIEERGSSRFAVKIESLQQVVIVNVSSDCLVSSGFFV